MASDGSTDRAAMNITFKGTVSLGELIDAMGQASVYVQASAYESFGCAIAEAMLCECVPVLSRRRANPEVGGDCAFYVDSLNPEEIASAFRQALASGLGPRARDRIARLFPWQKRRDLLLEALEGLNPERGRK